MFKLLKNRKGVTLVEVLAVIVILGIIAAIAVPTIGNLIENQRENAAETEWANVLDAARLYATSENPSGTFTLEDMVDDETGTAGTGSYISIDFGEYTTGTPEQTLAITDIVFDSSGNLSHTSGKSILINTFEVQTAISE